MFLCEPQLGDFLKVVSQLEFFHIPISHSLNVFSVAPLVTQVDFLLFGVESIMHSMLQPSVKKMWKRWSQKVKIAPPKVVWSVSIISSMLCQPFAHFSKIPGQDCLEHELKTQPKAMFVPSDRRFMVRPTFNIDQ